MQPPKPGLSASDHPAFIQDEVLESGVIEIRRSSALFLMREGAGAEVRAAIADHGLMVLNVRTAHEAKALGKLPRFAVFDVSLPGALELIRELTAPPAELQLVGIVRDGVSESAALEAGAAATLREPVRAMDVVRHLTRFQRHEELVAKTRELFERDQATASAVAAARIGAAITHEIRNPLAAALMNLATLEASTNRDGPRLSLEDRQEIYRDTYTVLRRIDTILSTVTSLARGERPHLTRLVLLDVAEAVLARVPNPGGIPVELRGSRLIHGFANRALLEQVLTNLLRNAFEAVQKADEPRILIRVYETASEARISVRDSGPGVPASVRARVFEPFVSTKGASGTGLGLAISREAMTSMGGALSLSEEQSPGACFRVRLRRA